MGEGGVMACISSVSGVHFNVLTKDNFIKNISYSNQMMLNIRCFIFSLLFLHSVIALFNLKSHLVYSLY